MQLRLRHQPQSLVSCTVLPLLTAYDKASEEQQCCEAALELCQI